MLWLVTASRTSSTDQGSHFTGSAFTGVLADNGIAISMTARELGDNFRRSLWRSGQVRRRWYLRAYDSVSDARPSIGSYLGFTMDDVPHSSLDGMTPDRGLLQTAALAWQPNPGRRSTYRCGEIVQTTGAPL